MATEQCENFLTEIASTLNNATLLTAVLQAADLTMIESVQVRHRGAYDFETHYENLCALQNSCPVPAIKSHLKQRILDINGDRIRANDWAPIMDTIKINKTLELIAVRSHFVPPDEADGDRKATARRKTPAVRSREMTVRLSKALKDCLVQSPTLNRVELQGIPLRNRDLTLLAKGITKSHALKHLSLELCNIGDEGLEVLSRSIKNAQRLMSLNLAACGLTADGAATIAKIVKNQAIRCHNEAWRESLRYRRPDLDAMPGIRRITLNQNPLIGDRGALFLAEILKDDLWLKALDLQNCCVTNVGARTFLQVLKFNSTMVLLDLRQNPLIDRDVLRGIMEQVLINSDGQQTQYEWLDNTTIGARERSVSPEKKTRRARTNSSRRPSVKVQASSNRKRSKSASAVPNKQVIIPQTTKPGPGFVPWRTAQRAIKYRDYASGQADDDGYDETGHVTTRSESPDNEHSMEHSPYKHGSKNDKNDLEQAKAMLMEERNRRLRAEQRLLELTSENTRLKHRVELIQRDGGATILDDDQLLDHIETSFAKFDAFLQMLRQAGLGKLVTMAGLDNTTMVPPTNDNDQSYRVTSTPTKSRYADAPPTLTPTAEPTNRVAVHEYNDLIGGEDEYKPNTADELYQRIKQQALAAIATRRDDVNTMRRDLYDGNDLTASFDDQSRNDVTNGSKNRLEIPTKNGSAADVSDTSLAPDGINYSSDFDHVEPQRLGGNGPPRTNHVVSANIIARRDDVTSTAYTDDLDSEGDGM